MCLQDHEAGQMSGKHKLWDDFCMEIKIFQGKLCYFLIQQCYLCPFSLQTFVSRIPVLMYCIFIYMKLCMNDLLSYPDDIFTVKLADQICYSGKEISTVQNATCTNQYDLHQTIKKKKTQNMQTDLI